MQKALLYFPWWCAARARRACPARKGLRPGDPRRSGLSRTAGRWLSVRARAVQRRLLPEGCPLPGPWLGASRPAENSGPAGLNRMLGNINGNQ